MPRVRDIFESADHLFSRIEEYVALHPDGLHLPVAVFATVFAIEVFRFAMQAFRIQRVVPHKGVWHSSAQVFLSTASSAEYPKVPRAFGLYTES